MKVKREVRQNLGIQLLALYLLFILPVFALGFFFYNSASQRLKEDVAAADLSLARAVALETDDLLLKSKEAVQAFAQMPPVIEADPAGMEALFSAGSAARQDINLFYRLSENGIMLYHYPPAPTVLGESKGGTLGRDFSFRDYFQQAKSTQDHVFSVGRISPTTGRPVVTSVMPVFKDNHWAGVVAINLELQRLSETVRRIGLKHPHNQELKIIIIDNAGQVIAHSEPEYLLADFSTTLPGLSEVLSSREGSVIESDAWGKEWLFTYSPIPIAGWGVVVQRPTRLAFASLINLQRGAIIALILFAVGAYLFWLYLSRRVILPLEDLTRYGKGVGQATFQAELDRESILPLSPRLDQIGQLTRTLLRAEQDIKQRLNELTTLNKTSAAVASTLNTQQVIDTILNEVQRLLQVSQCALLVTDKANERLQVQASRGLSRTFLETLNQSLVSQNLPAYQAIDSGRPIQITNIAQSADIVSLQSFLQAEHIQSLLVIPLNTPHVPPAALVIYRSDIHHFTEQEIDLAASFANQAAIALEHATLFSLTSAELQKQVRFLSALNRVARTVSQSLVFEEVLNNALDAVLEVMPVDACWIYLQRQTETFLRLRAQRGLPSALADELTNRRVEFGKGVIGQVSQTGEPVLLYAQGLQNLSETDNPIIAGEEWQAVGVVPLSAWGIIIGALGMASHSANTLNEGDTDLLQAIGDQIAIAVVNARLYRRSREVATLEERNRVAREIHDTLAQGFTGILIQLQAAERLSLKRPEQARHSLQEAQTLARDSLQEARRSIMNLRPAILEEIMLDTALSKQVQRFSADTGIEASFKLDGYPSPLEPELEQNLYRICQEALTNISRHAQASKASVSLSYVPGAVRLSITDNGIGLNGNVPSGNAVNGGAKNGSRPRFGLIGIQERVLLLGGQVIFGSPPGGGTEIKVEIPR